MDPETPDVNAEASSTPEPQEPAAPADSSAETLTTEPADAPADDRGPIPYERFKEVNDKYAELKTMQDSADWQGYQNLKDRLDRDQEFSNYFVDVIRKYGQVPEPVAEGPDPLADYPDEIVQPLRESQALKQTVQELLVQNQQQQQQNVRSQYLGRFHELVGKHDVPEHFRDQYAQHVELEAGRLNPNALSGYDQKVLDRAFDNVHQQMQTLERNIRSSYRVEKTSDRTPASSTQSGAAAHSTPKLRTSEDRANAAAAWLKSQSSG